MLKELREKQLQRFWDKAKDVFIGESQDGEYNKYLDSIDKEAKDFINKEFTTCQQELIEEVRKEIYKKKFMYEIQQEDVELIEDGKKLRKIRKIIT